MINWSCNMGACRVFSPAIPAGYVVHSQIGSHQFIEGRVEGNPITLVDHVTKENIVFSHAIPAGRRL